MVRTNTEYMSDRDTLDYVINRFINMTVKELNDIDSNDMNNAEKEIIDLEELSETKMQDMKFIELAFLIHNVGGNSDYDNYYSVDSCNSYILRMVLYRSFAKVLLAGDESSIPVRLFMAVPMEAFYRYLISISAGNDKKEELKREYLHMRKYYNNNPDYTIKDFIMEQIHESSKAWNPMSSLRKYAGNIKVAYNDIGRLLVKSFCLAFSGQYSVENICYKYQLEDKEYYEEFDEDFFYELDEDEVE